MVKFIKCTDCDFKGEVDEYNVVEIDYCPGCGKQLQAEDLYD